MYEKTIWPPKPSEPPKPTLEKGMVIRDAVEYFVVIRACYGKTSLDPLGGLRLFRIGRNGRLLSYNRNTDCPAMDMHEYKTCTAIWRTVDDFVADMERESGKHSTSTVNEVSALIDDAGRHIECATLERDDVQAFLRMLREAINTSAH